MAIRRVGDLLNGVSGDRCCDAVHGPCTSHSTICPLFCASPRGGWPRPEALCRAVAHVTAPVPGGALQSLIQKKLLGDTARYDAQKTRAPALGMYQAEA